MVQHLYFFDACTLLFIFYRAIKAETFSLWKNKHICYMQASCSGVLIETRSLEKQHCAADLVDIQDPPPDHKIAEIYVGITAE